MTFTKRMAVVACVFVGLTGQGFANPKNDFYELDLGRGTVGAQPLCELPGFEGADIRFLVQKKEPLNRTFNLFQIVLMPAKNGKGHDHYFPERKETLKNFVLTRSDNCEFLATQGDFANPWVKKGFSCHLLVGPDYLVEWADPTNEQGQMAGDLNKNSLEALVLLPTGNPMSDDQINMIKAYFNQNLSLKTIQFGGDIWEANGSHTEKKANGEIPYSAGKISNIQKLRDDLGLSPLPKKEEPAPAK